jgi:hypothetical protein
MGKQGKPFVSDLEGEAKREWTERKEEVSHLETEEGRRLTREQDRFELPPGKVAMPLRSEEEVFVLLHITHREQRPSCARPGFRILGAFASEAAMLQHARDVGAGNCSLWKMRTHELCVCCESTARQSDPDHVLAQRQRLFALHTLNTEDFKRSVQQQGQGSVGRSMAAREKAAQERAQKPGYRAPQAPHGDTLQATVTLQKFAVIGLLCDLRDAVLDGLEAPEPGVGVFRVFEDKDDAAFYAKYTAHAEYPACEIFVVDMYRWLFPEDLRLDEVEEVYGIKPLQNIMTSRKTQAQEAERFERFMEESRE